MRTRESNSNSNSNSITLSKFKAVNACKMKYNVETSKIATMLLNACGWESFLDKQEIHHQDLMGAIYNNIYSLTATLARVRVDYPELDTRILDVVNDICVFKDNTDPSCMISGMHTSLRAYDHALSIRTKLPYEEIIGCINKIIMNICGFMIFKVNDNYKLMSIFD